MVKLGAGFGSVSTNEEDDDRDYLASTCYLKKHKGETWRQVIETDPEYIEWVLFDSEVKLGIRLRQELELALEDR